jgi:hypothetical protein
MFLATRGAGGRASRPGLLVLIAAGLFAGGVRTAGADGPGPVDFSRDVRPILSDHCFACHGPDQKQRQAGLRLDTRDGAFGALQDGNHAVVPGKPDESDLVFRVEAEEPELRMPPPKGGKPLTAEQIATLRRWVEQGAPWSSHWSFEPPRPVEPPATKDAAWPRNPIDRFILARLEQEGLTPSPEADRTTLIRRVTLDLTGLPPTPEEVDAFLADEAPDAYEKLIDRLLQSSRYGEHMARFWLDAARYGDTHGLHLDNYREIWPYRDWVVRAFNRNLPFDQFVIEQLAGDLLPDATLEQIIATGYNRCHVSTSEGGSIEEEVYVRNVVDQVDTNGTVFLGLSIGCARCHDHKFDPVRMQDYYGLFALFNSIDGKPLDGNVKDWAPVVKVPSEEQKAALAALDGAIAAAKAKAAELARIPYDETTEADPSEYVRREDFTWVDDELPPGSQPAPEGIEFVSAPEFPAQRGSRSVRVVAEGLANKHFQNTGRTLRVGEGDVLFAYVFIDPVNPPKELMLQWRSDDWKHRAYWGENVIAFGADNSPERLRMGDLPASGQWARLAVEASKVGIKPGTELTGFAFTQQGGQAWWDNVGIETWTPQPGQTYETLAAYVRALRARKGEGLPEPVAKAIAVDRAKRDDAQKAALRAHFVEYGWSRTRAVFDPIHAEIASLQARREELDKQIPTTLVSKEAAEPRPAFILKRGEYDQRGEPAPRALPAFLPPMPEGQPMNRLGFARWLVDPAHPLTARVAVNRFWQQVFGTGIVKTAEDFGAQGEPPSHPELLDWLAIDFRDSGWNVKALMKQMLMSAAYRQTSRVTPDRLAKDPANRLLSRGPRFRLDAETLRDQAFFVSDLLVEKMGGPSVKPPQPAGLWEAVGFVGSDTATFKADTGVEKVHRRSLYTFWKRTSPPPQMTTFDAPSRESCTVRRERTNTPLQALLLMNEPQYVEASRALGERGLKQSAMTDEERIEYLFRLVIARRPTETERAALLAELADLRMHYQSNPEAAQKLVRIGETRPMESMDPAELAAWTLIGNTLLNLDEAVTKG